MKNIRWGSVLLMVWIGLVSSAGAEKFGSFGRDTLSQETASIPIPVPSMDTPRASSPSITPKPTPAVSIPEVTEPAISSVDTQAIKTPVPASASIDEIEIASPTSLPSAYNIKKPNISVPTFETRGMAMNQQELASKRKKKDLIHSIGDEIVKYWLFIVLAFVALLVVYALRKNTGISTLGDVPDKPLAEEKPKDIWDEF